MNPQKKYSFSREGGGIGEISIVKPGVTAMLETKPTESIPEMDLLEAGPSNTSPAIAEVTPTNKTDDLPASDEEKRPNENNDALLPAETDPPPNEETQLQPVKYPRAVAFIVTNEFCERFCFYGMRTILALYLKEKLHYTADTATIIYHVFIMFVYFFPIFGAMVADSWLGKFKTIVYLSIVYAIGNCVLSVGAIEPLDVSMRTMTIIGLSLIAIGTGGIKPCVSAFGGDQFVLPQQERQLAQFFSLFYFTINAGSFISTFLTPILRADVHCFGEDDCYPLAFGVPAILMVVSLIIFISGKFLYKMKQPQGNLLLEVSKCMIHAVQRKGKTEKKESWLDYADDKYDKSFIEDIKGTLRVLYLYIPLPMFWALYEQQGSRWTFQATRMSGDIGAFTIKPDQMQVVNPLLILAFIPIFESCLYPLLRKCNILTKQPSRLAFGGILTAVAFVMSAFVEFSLEKTYPVLPEPGNGQIRLFNGFNCEQKVTTTIPGHQNIVIDPLNAYTMRDIDVLGAKNFKFELERCDTKVPFNGQLVVREKEARSYFFHEKPDGSFDSSEYEDSIDKSDNGFPLIRILMNTRNKYKIELKDIETGEIRVETNTSSFMHTHKILPGSYQVMLDGKNENIETDPLKLGGVYTMVIYETDDGANKKYTSATTEITPPNSVHMLLLLPQYFVITFGEVMFSITGLEFSYSQAPASMKSVVTAAWLLTNAFGNLIVIIIAEAKIFESQAYEFLLFAAILVVFMGIFLLMARGYKYVEQKSTEQIDTDAIQMKSLKKDGEVNETFEAEN